MTEKNIDEIKSNIWQKCSIIRGLMPSSMQLSMFVIAFTFLRRIDCLIGKYAKECSSFFHHNNERLSQERLDNKLKEISGGYPFYNYSGYNFDELLQTNSSVEVALDTYLRGFSSNVQDILRETDFTQSLSYLHRQSRYLVELIQSFMNVDLSNLSVDNEEFVELISSLLSDLSRPFDFITTPLELSDLISECLLSEDLRVNADEDVTIYDPVCGTGGMLANAGVKAKRLAVHQTNISLYGQEISLSLSAVAKALILFSGNEKSKVHYGDTLTDDMFRDQRFQYIIANFPMGMSWKQLKEIIEMESQSNGRYHIGLPSSFDSQFLFIEHILSKMAPQGSRAAFITSAYALFGGSASSGESRIRRWLFENDMVETIIALPSGTLSVTSIPVYLWILTNRKKEAKKGKVRLIETSNLIKKGVRFPLNADFVRTVVDEYLSTAISTMSNIVRNEQFGFFEVTLLENGKKKETVRIPLDTDIEQFIEKERKPFAKGEITVDYSSVEKGYAVRFEDFFESKDDVMLPLKDISADLLNIIDEIAMLKPFTQQILSYIENQSNTSIWPTLPLRSAVDVISGNFKLPDPSENGLPFLSVAYLRNSSSDERYMVTPKIRCATNNDVIIITKGANTGEVFKGVDGILSPTTAAIRCQDESIITPHYLYYLIKGNERSLMSMARGASQKSIDMRMVLDIKCLVPPIEEQIRLASFLDSIIGKIDIIMHALKSSDNTFAVFRQALIENVVQGKYNFN